MAVQDYAHESRWLIYRMGSWRVCPPNDTPGPIIISRTFAEAHAAYLDAVTCPELSGYTVGGRCSRARGHEGFHDFTPLTCDALTPFSYYTEPRCSHVRNHKGPHLFKSKKPVNAPLQVNPR